MSLLLGYNTAPPHCSNKSNSGTGSTLHRVMRRNEGRAGACFGELAARGRADPGGGIRSATHCGTQPDNTFKSCQPDKVFVLVVTALLGLDAGRVPDTCQMASFA